MEIHPFSTEPWSYGRKGNLSTLFTGHDQPWILVNLYRIFHGYASLPEATPLKTNEYPLKIDGWKMECPFKLVPFQVTC